MVQKYEFTFIFNRLDKTYCPGETLQCTINAKIYEKLKNVTSLEMRFMGVTYVEFPVGEHKTHETKLYFREYQTVFGEKDGPPVDIEPGRYTYESFFQLPLGLPSSFKHLYGYVDYTIKAEYEFFKTSEANLFIENFLVQAPLSLDDIPLPFKPVEKTIKRSFGYGLGRIAFYKSGPLCITHRLSKLVWEPGEKMHILIEVNNKSAVAVKSIRLEIVEKITFSVVRVINKKIIDTKILFKDIFEPEFCNEEALVPPSEKKIFETNFFIDPILRAFPVFSGCPLLRAEYFVRTVAVTQGLHFNAENKTKIYIGKILCDINRK